MKKLYITSATPGILNVIDLKVSSTTPGMRKSQPAGRWLSEQ